MGTLLAAALAVPARAQMTTGSYIQVSSAAITGNMGIGTAVATSRLDVRGGSLSLEGLPVEVFLASATQTASVTTGGVQVWAAATGASGSFTLARTMTVRMRAHGSANPISGAHCGMRFVVDSVGQGDASWGDVVFYAVGGWSAWSMEREASLAAGNHTISVQQVANLASGCLTNVAEYSATRLWIYGR